MSKHLPGRAETLELKQQMIERLMKCWLEQPELRLGQLLCNAGYSSGIDDLFYIEDENLIEATERFVIKGK